MIKAEMYDLRDFFSEVSDPSVNSIQTSLLR